MFSIASGAAKVFTKPAHPEVIMKTIMPLARMSSILVSDMVTRLGDERWKLTG
jgi:hypothetical protein